MVFCRERVIELADVHHVLTIFVCHCFANSLKMFSSKTCSVSVSELFCIWWYFVSFDCWLVQWYWLLGCVWDPLCTYAWRPAAGAHADGHWWLSGWCEWGVWTQLGCHDSGSEAAAPVTEAQRERQLRELQLQVCSDTLSRTSPVHSTETHLYMPYVLNKSETRL